VTTINNVIRCAVAVFALVAFVVVPVVGSATDDAVVKRGATIGHSPVAILADVMKNPSEFVGKSLILEGNVAEVCAKKGCWMEVLPEADSVSVRVTFKDYGFFVPKDCHGMIARMEGQFERKELSKEDADHMEAEGARIIRNPDGTATELGFVAAGVELRPGKEKNPEKKSK